MELVLSLFPGIGLLDRGFEDSGFAVVRGPDLIFGGDIRKFKIMPGKFDGIIGGPPCQDFQKPDGLSRQETD
jgi:Site-specific DNA methylase